MKWDVSSRLPIKDDIVLFTWTDSGYGKDQRTWKLQLAVEKHPLILNIFPQRQHRATPFSGLVYLGRIER